jgi:hypothetical protein
MDGVGLAVRGAGGKCGILAAHTKKQLAATASSQSKPESQATADVAELHRLQTVQGDSGVPPDQGLQTRLVRAMSCLPRSPRQGAVSSRSH